MQKTVVCARVCVRVRVRVRVRVCVCVCLCLHADVSRFSCGSCYGYALGWHVCSDPSDALQMPHRTERTGQNIGMNSVTRTHAHRKSEWPKPNTEKR